ncbi:MAG: hypothetical protein ACLQK8_15250 [Streptosporangiaceae bacterium]
MAIIEVSEDGVRRAVGGEVFGQAEDWVGKVSGLETDGPVISATVDGIPVSVRILPDGITGECGCPAHGLCVHAAAAVLAWVRTGTDAGDPDLFEVLRVQNPDWLATRLAELAAADPVLAGRLLAEAEDGQALQDVESLRAELDRVLDELEDEASSLGLHDEWYPDGEALDELLDEAAEFVPDTPDAVRALADHVITRTERLLNYENCYGEGITEALEKAQDVHLAACEAGTPDPEALAQRLATGALESGWGVFHDGPAKYARVLGAAGLARYRELLTNAPARQHGQDALWTSLLRAEKAHAAD